MTNPELEELLELYENHSWDRKRVEKNQIEFNLKLQQISDKLGSYEIIKSGLEDLLDDYWWYDEDVRAKERIKELLEKTK